MPSPDFTPNNVWAETTPEGTEEELVLPSGQTCRARKMSIESMIKTGMLSDADSLTSQVQKHTRKVKGGNKKPDGVMIDEKSFMKDSTGITAMVKVMNQALPHIVTSPAVAIHTVDETVGKTTVTRNLTAEEKADIRESQPGIVFTDQIDFMDKVHLFKWAAGGLTAMLEFRG